jgi:glycosyltransferase involved in cell wall biosynthesis
MEISFGINAILSRKLRGPSVILISPAMLSSALVMLWLKTTRPKTEVIVWVQDLYEQGLKETKQEFGLTTKFVSFIENWLLRQADKVIMAHPAFLTAKNLVDTNTNKFSSIPNWTQFNFKPTENASDTRARHQLGTSKIVLHIGNMGVKQGLEHVIEAARLADVRQSKIIFVFVGAGNQSDKLREISNGLTNVKFIPPVSESELSNLLHAADLLLVNEKPGVKEMSIPSKLTTYFLTGNPVLVCSEKDSLAGRSVVDNGIGYWVQSGTPSALLARIESLDSEQSGIVAKKAKEFAKVNLSKEAALSKFAQTLQKL